MAVVLGMTAVLTACGNREDLKTGNLSEKIVQTETEAVSADQKPIKEALLEAADTLEPSSQLYFENGLKINGLAVNWSGDAVKTTDNFYWKSIEKLTGTTFDIFWAEEENYTGTVASTLLNGEDEMPDIINLTDFGVMDLADDGVLIALDDYMDLIPDIVAAVGEERMNSWKQVDGHIYSIPSIVDVPGAQTMMVRKDWLDQLGMEMPETWEDWVNLWRAIRDNDLNGNGDPTDEIPFSSQYGYDGERCLLPLLNAFGIRTSGDCQFCILDDGTYTMVYEHPEYPAFLEAMQQLYQEGLIDPKFTERNEDELFDAMDQNLVGTTYTWAEKCRTSSRALRDAGVEKALWEASKPIAGPDGNRITPERNTVSKIWSITTAAQKNGKLEDILRFFNWCFTEEGSNLYSYGLEGISYDMTDGKAVLNSEMTANGFTDYRAAGCNIECFGGLWKQDAFMQCLFEGKTLDELDELSKEFYNGIGVVNDGYFYNLPNTLQTDAYLKYRSSMITEGICQVRDAAVKGEISLDDFWKKYEEYKEKGLKKIIDAGMKAAEIKNSVN